MDARTMEKFGFNPVKNMFPEMDCRICGIHNPFAFMAPKPKSGKPGDSWHCVCADCAENRLGWVDKRTGQLKPGVSI